ncbi:MAG: murein biosynthesis integral membrane protein MurJ [Fibrobacteraceae bacterium]|nr:murein biosynthesis integral membrane protein MurJ [Fibrobacteraceae bacterium]
MNKAAIIIAVSMLLSRVLGIVREMLLAHAAGVSLEKNALDLAFMIPDILNHVVSTGFLSIIFIPIFTGYKVAGKEEESWKFFSNVLNTFGMVLLILVVPAFIFMPELLNLLTRSGATPELLSRATYYGRIILPGQVFIFVGSILVAVQHTRKQFLIPSLTGLIYNAAVIIGGTFCIYMSKVTGVKYGLEGFAWGVPIGAFIGFFALQIFGAKRGGIQYKLILQPKHPDIIRYFKMMLPMSLGVGSMFGLEFIIRSFGASFGSSGISSLNYAYRVMYTLVAVFGFSVSVASYPDMARLVKENRMPELNQKIWKSLSRMFCVLIPAVVAVYALSFPAVRILFERGAFSREATENIAEILRWYLPVSLGLCLQAVLVRSFYAAERMWAPTLLNTGIFAATIPAYIFLSEPLGIKSVPIVGAAGALLQVVSMIFLWAKRNGTQGMKNALMNMLRALATFVVMIGAAMGLDHLSGEFVRNINLATLILYSAAAGIALFVLTLFIQKILGSKDASDILNELLGKILRKLHLKK